MSEPHGFFYHVGLWVTRLLIMGMFYVSTFYQEQAPWMYNLTIVIVWVVILLGVFVHTIAMIVPDKAYELWKIEKEKNESKFGAYLTSVFIFVCIIIQGHIVAAILIVFIRIVGYLFKTAFNTRYNRERKLEHESKYRYRSQD